MNTQWLNIPLAVAMLDVLHCSTSFRGIAREEALMATVNRRSNSLQKRIEKTKVDARKRVIKRGILHFRCDEEMMDHLLKVAHYRKLPVGSMVRSWVADRLRKEISMIGEQAL